MKQYFISDKFIKIWTTIYFRLKFKIIRFSIEVIIHQNGAQFLTTGRHHFSGYVKYFDSEMTHFSQILYKIHRITLAGTISLHYHRQK